jgi:hypothetical protein
MFISSSIVTDCQTIEQKETKIHTQYKVTVRKATSTFSLPMAAAKI